MTGRLVLADLRRVPGTSHRIGRCPLCGERVRVHVQPGVAECVCGALYTNLTGALLDQRPELGHPARRDT